MTIGIKRICGIRGIGGGASIKYQKYGISWAESSDLSAVTRTLDAVGLTAVATIGATVGHSDFDTIYPWSEMKTCNKNGSVITYEGEPGFSRTGSNGNVYVEIPKTCIERKVAEGVESITVSKGGLPVHEAFIENGVVVPKIYVSAYKGSVVDGVLKSISGVRPAENYFPQQFLDMAKLNGADTTLYDARTVDLLQILAWVEFGNRNLSQKIGFGHASYIQPVPAYKSVIAEISNRFVIGSILSNNDLERLFAGSNLTICQSVQTNIIARRKVVSCTVNSPSAGQTQLVFDGEPISIDTNTFFGNGPRDNGESDALAYKTGRTNRARVIPGSTVQIDRLNQNCYRGIEGISGNCWHYLPDISFNNLQMYSCKNMSEYEFHKITGSYLPVGTPFTVQSSNTGDAFWMITMFYDPANKAIPFGKTFGTSTYLKYFGGFYYLNTGLMAIANGGGFDHEARCNIATQRAWITPTSQWFLYGARLIAKPI